MNFFRKNIRTIIGFLVGAILASSITVYGYTYLARDVNYIKSDGTEINVENALNELYNMKKNVNISDKPFHTITSANASYTAPRDCLLYIYAGWNSSGYAAYVYLNGNSDENIILTSDNVCIGDTHGKRSHLMHIKEGDVISTRSGVSGLTYLLEFYD